MEGLKKVLGADLLTSQRIERGCGSPLGMYLPHTEAPLESLKKVSSFLIVEMSFHEDLKEHRGGGGVRGSHNF